MKKPVTTKVPAEQVLKDIRRTTHKLHSSEEKIRIVLSGLRGDDSIAELCRKEGIAQSLYAAGRRNSSRPAIADGGVSLICSKQSTHLYNNKVSKII